MYIIYIFQTHINSNDCDINASNELNQSIIVNEADLLNFHIENPQVSQSLLDPLTTTKMYMPLLKKNYVVSKVIGVAGS